MTDRKKKPSQSGKLTNFFPVKSGPSSSQRSDPSKSSQVTLASSSTKVHSKVPPRPDQEIISISSTSVRSHISISSASPSPDLPTSIARLPATSKLVPHNAGRKSLVTKRSRSPEVQIVRTCSKPTAATVVRHRKKPKVEDDSDVEPLSAAANASRSRAPVSTRLPETPISIQSSPRPLLPLSPRENLRPARVSATPAKKQAPSITLDSDTDGQIPSSQSDERELCAPRGSPRDAEEVKASVDKWRVEAAVIIAPAMSEPDVDIEQAVDIEIGDVRMESEPPPSDEPFAPDVDSSSCHGPPDDSHAELTLNPDLGPRNDPLENARATAPDRVPAPAALPGTPAALSVKAKTDQIIAQIKAAAFAAAVSSPEPEPVRFPEVQESSDDEEPVDLCILRKTARKNMRESSAEVPLMATVDEPGSSSASRAYPRRSTRHTSQSSYSHTIDSSFSSGGNRWRPDLSDTTPDPPSDRPASRPKILQRKKDNPLAALLRDKRLAEKRSRGYNSVSRAEDAINARMCEVDTEDDANSCEMDERWDDGSSAERSFTKRIRERSSDNPACSAVIGEEEVGRLVGKKQAKAIGDILFKDRKGKQMGGERDNERNLGVPLWEEGACADNKGEIQDWDIDLGDRCVIVNALQDAVDLGDMALASVFLNSGVVGILPASDRDRVVPWLFAQALSLYETPLTVPSFRLLSSIVSPTVGIPLSMIKIALLRLSARPAVFDAADWKHEVDIPHGFLDHERRTIVVHRLVALIEASARSKAIPDADVADLLLILHLIAMDPGTLPDLGRELIVVIDLVCNSLRPDDVIIAGESVMCTKLLQFSYDLTPSDKSMFISFLSGGSGRTRRIGRWVAHGLLTSQRAIAEASYGDLPPLDPILALLTPIADDNMDPKPDARIFDFQQNAAATNYEDLGHYIHVLSVALSSIDAYATRDAPQTPRKQVKKDSEKPASLLEMIRHALHVMYEKINDRGGAFLDRSRTKEAIQHLELRIEYQRIAALKSGRAKQKRDLRAFFRKRTD